MVQGPIHIRLAYLNYDLDYNVFIKKLMKNVINTKSFTTISGVLFLRLTCCDTKTHTKTLIATHVCLFIT